MSRARLRLSAPFVWIVACSLLACGDRNDDAAREIPVSLEQVSIDRAGRPVLLLEDDTGARVLPIWVGLAEARSIAARLEAVELPRPNTHDLTQRLVEGLDARLERVVVTELRGGTYYGLIVMHGADGAIRIDSRPSDAIALALRMNAPIFVVEDLFEREAVRSEEAPSDEEVPEGEQQAI